MPDREGLEAIRERAARSLAALESWGDYELVTDQAAVDRAVLLSIVDSQAQEIAKLRTALRVVSGQHGAAVKPEDCLATEPPTAEDVERVKAFAREAGWLVGDKWMWPEVEERWTPGSNTPGRGEPSRPGERVWTDYLSTFCPECGSAPGKACRETKGKDLARVPHRSRIAATPCNRLLGRSVCKRPVGHDGYCDLDGIDPELVQRVAWKLGGLQPGDSVSDAEAAHARYLIALIRSADASNNESEGQ